MHAADFHEGRDCTQKTSLGTNLLNSEQCGDLVFQAVQNYSNETWVTAALPQRQFCGNLIWFPPKNCSDIVKNCLSAKRF